MTSTTSRSGSAGRAAPAALPAGVARAQQAANAEDRLLNDQSGTYRDVDRADRGRLRPPGACEEFGTGHGFNVEVLYRRPPEQARCRLQHRPAMDRPRRGRHDRRCARTPSVALAVDGVAREKNKVYLNTSARRRRD